MTTPAAPTSFATVDDVGAGWRALSEQDRINVRLLLDAAAMWIRNRVPDIADDHPGARFVSIDVVRSAMEAGANRGMSSFSKTIGPWSKSGTLINPSGALTFTVMHRELLGIAGGVGEPLFNFPVGDY